METNSTKRRAIGCLGLQRRQTPRRLTGFLDCENFNKWALSRQVIWRRGWELKTILAPQLVLAGESLVPDHIRYTAL
ncbi:MAG: hypothetical protein ACK2UT_04375, partial [Candidatus Promineifilaceae bacterium]